ncbi:MAG: RecQ family ATP-dependent DNA helicase [Clostridium sp.]
MDTVLHNIDLKFKEEFPVLASGFCLKDFQKRVIKNVLDNGNTLCIMPTGGGKSIIYWMSGLLLDGITIVISPLIALIDEQSEKLKENGYEVLAIHGGMDSNKQSQILKDFANKKFNPKFIFVSPEKIATDGLFEYCISKRKEEITMFAIDEVHCVSQWGTSFRPFYKRIPDFIEKVFEEGRYPKVLSLTATLNAKEIIDICNEFNISKSNIIKDNLLMRPEISLKVLKFSNEDEKEEKFWDLLKIHKHEKVLIYVYRIESERGVERLSEKAVEKGYNSICFHGEMTAKQRKEIISKYKNNDINIIFATNAFGMGIDIPDVRTVIHFMIPESVEQYYQEVGRAARDGKAANAYLLYTNKNIDVKRRYFIDGSFPSEDKLINTYEKFTNGKLGLKTLPYFEDEDIQKSLMYYVNIDMVKLICKGFSDFKGILSVDNKELEDIIKCTKTKNLISTVKKAEVEVDTLVNMTYESFVNDQLKLSKPLDRRLIVNVNEENIDEENMRKISMEIEEKRKYKYELLDYLVYLIAGSTSSNELHQEIGKYLGIDKHQLGRINATTKGDLVRSKSEVIIANLLHQYGIDYEYEKKLNYKDKWIEPDFTIILNNGEEYYWEHLGMLGIESYDNRWLEKQEIYDKYFKGKLIVSYEGATISESTIDIIKKKLLKK